MLLKIRRTLSDYLWLSTLEKHRSRMGWWHAPRYTKYWTAVRKHLHEFDELTVECAKQFEMKGWSSFTDPTSRELATTMLDKIKSEEESGIEVFDSVGRYQVGDIYQTFPEIEELFRGKVGDFLRAVLGCDFKIYFGLCYKSAHRPDGPSGSQLWHADGGPGTGIKLMWCLSPVTAKNGAMECLDWEDSLNIFKQERSSGTLRKAVARGSNKIENRKLKTDFFSEAISNSDVRINQPTAEEGMILTFLNNTLHRGGFPQPGHERYVCVFTIYPSAVPTPFEHYQTNGISKGGSGYPADPAFGD